MKRFITLVVLLLIGVLFFTGCMLSGKESNTNCDLSLTNYINKQSENIIKPSVTLQEGNRFEFFYAEENSYKAVGNYEISDGKLYLETDDEKYKFVFVLKNKTLIFSSKESSLPADFKNVSDQTVFEP